jgi:hypothetical protein
MTAAWAGGRCANASSPPKDSELADALELPRADGRRDRLIGRVLAACPDELLAEVAEEAAGRLWLRGLRPTDR